jgi:alcohol dehydrogenase class IV
MSLVGNWNYPTTVRFGAGRIRELATACADLGIRRPLLVTDPGLMPLPPVAAAREALAGLPVAVFSDVRPNPVGKNVDDGVAAFKAAGCDGVVALGGGSTLDVAKAIALMVGQTRPLWDFEDVGDWYTRVDPAGMAPVVAIPTTSGTGSEVGRASVITKEDEHRKLIIFHPRMLPGRVIADPALTVGLPAKLTAAVGMDALSHNLEAYCAPGFHPQADGIAMEGMRLVNEALVTAVRDGSDLTARSQMMAASLMGAAAFQKGLGGMHALAHPIGAQLDAHHGLINAIVMPYVLAFNRSAIEDRLARLARVLDLPGHSATSVIDWTLSLREQIGIPHTLASIGVTEAHFDALAPAAVADPSAGGNPIPLDVAATTSLLRHALEGRLP